MQMSGRSEVWSISLGSGIRRERVAVEQEALPGLGQPPCHQPIERCVVRPIMLAHVLLTDLGRGRAQRLPLRPSPVDDTLAARRHGLGRVVEEALGIEDEAREVVDEERHALVGEAREELVGEVVGQAQQLPASSSSSSTIPARTSGGIRVEAWGTWAMIGAAPPAGRTILGITGA